MLSASLNKTFPSFDYNDEVGGSHEDRDDVNNWVRNNKHYQRTPLVKAISRSSQCSTTGVTKAVPCAILYVGLCI